MFRQTLELITATILLAEVLSPWLAKLFLGGAPDVLAIAIPALRLYSFSLIPCAIVVTFKNYYQGTNRMALTHLISVLDALVFTTLFPWLLSMPYGLTGVWLGITVGELAVQLAIRRWRGSGTAGSPFPLRRFPCWRGTSVRRRRIISTRASRI